jgi:hypothetical protein
VRRKYFYSLLVAVIGTSLFSLAAWSSDDALNQLRQLIKAEPQLCPDDRACYCVRYTPLAKLPVRYAKAKYCAVSSTADGSLLLKFTSWDAAGHKVDEGYFLRGKMHGLWISWHPNGAKASESRYENGKQVGRFITWHENGQVAITGEHKDGEPDGVWLYRDPEGRLEKRLEWKEGALISKEDL